MAEPMDTWRQERIELSRQTTAIAAGITSALASLEPANGWTLESLQDEDNHGTYRRIHGINGETLCLSFDHREKKVSVSGGYGQKVDGSHWSVRDSYRGDLTDPSATMSYTRPAAKLALDISRRVLPVYRQLLDVYQEHFKRDTDYRAGSVALFDELVALTNGGIRPGRVDSPGSADRTGSFYQDRQGTSYGDLRVSGPTSIELKMSVTPDFARKLCALIGSMLARKDQE